MVFGCINMSLSMTSLKTSDHSFSFDVLIPDPTPEESPNIFSSSSCLFHRATVLTGLTTISVHLSFRSC